MNEIMRLKEMLHKEIAEVVTKGEIPPGSIETIEKTLDAIKDCCEIIEKDNSGYSQSPYVRMPWNASGYYYGNSYGDTYGNMGGGYDGMNGGHNGYSRDDGKNRMIAELDRLKGTAMNGNEKDVIERALNQLKMM